MNLQNLLKLMGVAIVGIAAIHVVLGPGADLMLGSGLSKQSRVDPSTDSQNRFYGAAFALYGLLLFYCSGDIVKYRPVLLICIGTFFVAGLARLVSVLQTGWPSTAIVGLLAIEPVLPPLLILWLRRATTTRNAP
jgi:hypothetical protein